MNSDNNLKLDKGQVKSAAKFTASSMISAAVDLSVYYVLVRIISLPQAQLVFAATVISRVASGTVNYIINRRWSFQSNNKPIGELLRFAAVFIVKMCLSAFFVTRLSFIKLPSVVIKMIVDTILFFANYVLQKLWVFKKRDT